MKLIAHRGNTHGPDDDKENNPDYIDKCLSGGYDAEIDVLDIIQIANLILSNQFEDLADLNQDGIINVIDITLVVNIILE